MGSSTLERQLVLNELPPRRNGRIGAALLLGLVLLLGALVSQLLERPAIGVLCVVLTLLLPTLLIAAGERSRRRGTKVDRFASGIARRVGASAPSRELVRARRWSHWWAGSPRTVSVAYAADVDATATEFRRAIREQARTSFLTAEQQKALDYDVAEHKRRRADGVLYLELVDVTPGTVNHTRAHVKTVIQGSVDKSADVTMTLDADGEPTEIVATLMAGRKELTVDGYRDHVDRAVSVWLPGKWKSDWKLQLRPPVVTYLRRPPLPKKRDNEPIDLGNRSPLELYGEVEIPFAVDEYGDQLSWAPWLTPMMLITGGTGRGKASGLSTRVPTPTGWTTMGALHVGDVVLGRDGRPCRVLALSDIDHTPRLFRLRLSDGQEIYADGNHQWVVSRFRDRRRPSAEHRRTAIANAAARSKDAERLRALAATFAAEHTSRWSELLDLVRPIGRWNTELSVRAALAMVDVGPHLEERTIDRHWAATEVRKQDPVPLYPAAATLSALADHWEQVPAHVQRQWGDVHARRVTAARQLSEQLAGQQLCMSHLQRHMAAEDAGFNLNRGAKRALKRAGITPTRGLVDVVSPRVPTMQHQQQVQVFHTAEALRGLATRLLQQNEGVGTLDIDEEILSTDEILAAGVRDHTGRIEFSIRLANAWDLPNADLPLDPYVLGAWLGDGTSRDGGLASSIQDLPSLLEQFSAAGFEIRRSKRLGDRGVLVHFQDLDGQSLRAQLASVGLARDGAKFDKRIPLAYLRASREQRLAVLQGLMDTDGHCQVSGRCELTLTKRDLAEDALELIRSLGIKATMHTSDAAITEDDPDRPGARRRRVTGLRHRIAFTTDVVVFRMPRKAERLPTSVRPTQRMLYIESIEPVAPEDPAYEPARCITVDSPDSTYLVEGSVPTHNTVMEHTLLTNIARMGWELWILDGKAIEFLGYRDWPNVGVVASWIEEQVAIIHAFHAEMLRRYSLIVRGKATEADFAPMFLLIDEYRTFQEEATDWYLSVKRKNEPAKVPAFAKLAGIARLGRSARMHVIVGLQRPDAEFLHGEMRENFSMRSALGRVSPEQSRMMWNTEYTGVALPARTRGRGYSINGDGEPVESLALWTPDPRRATNDDDVRLLDALQPAPERTLHERKMFALPQPTQADLEQVTGLPSYASYVAAPLVPFEATPDEDDEVARLEEKASASVVPDESDDVGLEGYGPETQVPLSALEPGMLVQLSGGRWGVYVEPPVEDPETDGQVLLRVTDLATGEADTTMVAVAAALTVRAPIPSPFGGFQEPTHVRLSELQVGDLVLVDGDQNTWGVLVDEPHPSPDVDGEYELEVREFSTEQPLQLVVSDEELQLVRVPIRE